MKNLHRLDRYRVTSNVVVRLYGSIGDKDCGVFNVLHARSRSVLRVIASSDSDWDHVSVSLPSRCPTWEEMDYIKRLFFEPDEAAMQLHVPVKQHISNHPYCLHLWRPKSAPIPMPPANMV